ncbi:hypothetical protein ABH924_004336 [Arthrobacter sp. GAS37]|uniref:hypothetical protein n=1 Tax=Arthrobacter sp. GAS37 TaxID=3156261 RepID=UPI003835A9D7
MTEVLPPRHNRPWIHEDYDRTFEALRQGLSDDDIADHVGRKKSAVARRLRDLIRHVSEHQRPPFRAKALESFRGILEEDPGFPWEEKARDFHRSTGRPWWVPGAEDILRTAWESGDQTMHELTRTLCVREDHIADWMVRTGSASNTIEVVERLGCLPGGRLEANARIARDKASMLIWVLILTEQRIGVVHTSLHHDKESASHELDSLLPPDDAPLNYRSPHRWMIAERIVGEGHIRSTKSGSFFPQADPE